MAKSKKNPAKAGGPGVAGGAAGTTSSERRATLEKLRAEERSKARRRTAMMVAPALVLAVIVGVMVALQLKQASKPGGALASIGVPASAAGCQDVVVEKAEGNQDHRPEGETIDYADSPPATGPHWGQFLFGGQVRKFWTTEDRPPVERLVHSLEHGYTILWYDPTIAKDDKQVDQLKELADQFSGSALEDKFMAAPWTEADVKDRGSDFPEGTHLALTHWSMGGTHGNPKGQHGIWQYCGKVSGAAVSSFMEDYPYSDSPEPRAG